MHSKSFNRELVGTLQTAHFGRFFLSSVEKRPRYQIYVWPCECQCGTVDTLPGTMGSTCSRTSDMGEAFQETADVRLHLELLPQLRHLILVDWNLEIEALNRNRRHAYLLFLHRSNSCFWMGIDTWSNYHGWCVVTARVWPFSGDFAASPAKEDGSSCYTD